MHVLIIFNFFGTKNGNAYFRTSKTQINGHCLFVMKRQWSHAFHCQKINGITAKVGFLLIELNIITVVAY